MIIIMIMTNWRNRSCQLYPQCVYQFTVGTSCLCCHGKPEQSLKDVFQATVFAKITYCLPAWSGFCTAADRTRIDSFMRRCVKLGYYSSSDMLSITSIADNAEDTIIGRILKNPQHVLQAYLDQRPQLCYNLRKRNGINKTLIEKTVDLNDRYFFRS